MISFDPDDAVAYGLREAVMLAVVRANESLTLTTAMAQCPWWSRREVLNLLEILTIHGEVREIEAGACWRLVTREGER